MKLASLIAIPLIFLLTSSQTPNTKVIDKKLLSGNITLMLKHGVWKLWQEKKIYQNITLDLVCHQGQCESEAWGYAPKFNQEVDHQGTVKVINVDNTWQLQVTMNIQFHPWRSQVEKANYTIDIIPYKEQLIGNYTGTFNKQDLQGSVKGTINPLMPQPVVNFQSLRPQEHPRLIFRKDEISNLREKAKTPTGKKILAQLNQSLAQKIYYDGYVPTVGYHATGYCFLSLLNQDSKSAETAWKIVEKSIKQPRKRLLEQSPVVAGVALAYDLCYDNWSQERRQKTANWLYSQARQLLKGDSPRNGWNSTNWSNWSARARGAAGLAALAIIDESIIFSKKTSFNQESPQILAKIAQRNIQRYLTTAIGEKGFGTEGDHYTTEPYVLTIIPFLQAYKNVMGEDLIKDSNAEWMISHYLMRTVIDGDEWIIPSYGRHQRYAGKSLFEMGIGIAPDRFVPSLMWLLNGHLGIRNKRNFISFPHADVYLFANYPKAIVPQNPALSLDKILVDRQKGFYVFRKQWQDRKDFVASIYLKQQFLGNSWSLSDVGSYRIWGLGGHWAIADPAKISWDSENVTVIANAKPWQVAKPIFFQSRLDGSGIVSLQTNPLTLNKKSKSPAQISLIRSFAVDYSQVSGVPGLFVVVDKFIGSVKEPIFKNKTWVMNTQGKVTLKNNRFVITAANGTTMQGTFIVPSSVNLAFEKTKDGGRIIATGSNEFFVVMTVQNGTPPKVEILGSGLTAQVKVGKQEITFEKDRIVLSRF